MVKINKNVGISVLVAGIIQALIGAILLICCIVFTAKITGGTVITPYWSAIPMLISGSIAIACGITRNNCMLISILIFNIILHIMFIIATALSALVAAVFGVAAKIIDSNCREFNGQCWCDGKAMHSTCDNVKTMKTLLDCFAAFNALAAIVSLALAIMGCAGLCCYKETEGAVVHHVQGGQTVIITNHQQQLQQGPMQPGFQQPPPGAMHPGYPQQQEEKGGPVQPGYPQPYPTPQQHGGGQPDYSQPPPYNSGIIHYEPQKQ